jgi:hypothetical protein
MSTGYETESQPVASGVDYEDLNEFIALSDQLDDLAKQQTQLKAQRDKVEERLIEQYALTATQSMNVAGRCIYRHSETYANAIAAFRAELVAWATENDLDEMIVVQPARFKSYCKELMDTAAREASEAGEPVPAAADRLPEEIRGMVSIFEKSSIRIRKS